jgi:hypothetical protein
MVACSHTSLIHSPRGQSLYTRLLSSARVQTYLFEKRLSKVKQGSDWVLLVQSESSCPYMYGNPLRVVARTVNPRRSIIDTNFRLTSMAADVS